MKGVVSVRLGNWEISINWDCLKSRGSRESTTSFWETVWGLLTLFIAVIIFVAMIMVFVGGCGGGGGGAASNSLPQTQYYQLIAECLYNSTRLTTAAIYADDNLVTTSGYYSSQIAVNSQVRIRPRDQVQFQNKDYHVDFYSIDGGSDLPMTVPEVIIIMSGNRIINFRYSQIPTPP